LKKKTKGLKWQTKQVQEEEIGSRKSPPLHNPTWNPTPSSLSLVSTVLIEKGRP